MTHSNDERIIFVAIGDENNYHATVSLILAVNPAKDNLKLGSFVVLVYQGQFESLQFSVGIKAHFYQGIGFAGVNLGS